MLQTRQELETLVARPAHRGRMLPHAGIMLAGIGVSIATVMPSGPPRVAAFAVLALVAVVVIRTVRRLAGTIRLVVDSHGITWPGGDLLVPWADVIALALVDRGIVGPALRVEVRDGPGLLARQRPEASIARGHRLGLERNGRLECGLMGWDHPALEVFEAAAAHLRATSREELETIETGPVAREVRRQSIA
jgi:hypothetical protein